MPRFPPDGNERFSPIATTPVEEEPSGDGETLGQVTALVTQLLADTAPGQLTRDNLERALKERFEEGIVVHYAREDAGRPLFDSVSRQRASQIITSLEQQPLREVVATLEQVIAAREGQDDLWPEGRMNAGIALAELGEFEAAKRQLQDAVDLLSGRDPRLRDYAMAF